MIETMRKPCISKMTEPIDLDTWKSVAENLPYGDGWQEIIGSLRYQEFVNFFPQISNSDRKVNFCLRYQEFVNLSVNLHNVLTELHTMKHNLLALQNYQQQRHRRMELAFYYLQP